MSKREAIYNFNLQLQEVYEYDGMRAHDVRTISDKEMKLAIANLVKKLPKSPTNWQLLLMRKLDGTISELETVDDFRFIWLAQSKSCREHIYKANLVGGTFAFHASSRQFTP